MRKLTLLLLSILLSLGVTAQKGSVTGSIVDTLNKIKLANTAISISGTKDSVLYKTVRASENGSFVMKDIMPGKYSLLVSYPGYVAYTDTVEIKSDGIVNLGNICILTASHLLQDVVVRQAAAIRMRGDTIEFRADSFKVAAGANVEDLLKKLPGLQIDKNGNITAMGEKVQKVLVDGEEFFGNDPTIATQNLQASSIDKVQVYDKKSEQTEFSGIDDGQKIKTVNLKLKENAKKGYFGKLELTASDKRWNNSAMFNRFRSKQKFSVYGIMSNTGKTGLSGNDQEKFGGGSDEESVGVGSDYGIPKSWSGGANYSNKFNEDKHSINSSYMYNKLSSNGYAGSIYQSIVPDNIFVTKSGSNSITERQQHALNGTYEWQIDSLTSIKVIAKGITAIDKNFSNSNSIMMNDDKDTISNTTRFTSSEGGNQRLSSAFIVRRKFKKAGRTLSLSFDHVNRSSSYDGLLLANIASRDLNNSPIHTITDQLKKNNSNATNLSALVIYSEPLIKNVFGEIRYGIGSNNSGSERLSYNKSADGRHHILDKMYSNKFEYDINSNHVGIAFRYNDKKITSSIGSNLEFQKYQQNNILIDTIRTMNYRKIAPRADFAYKINSNSRFSINYNGNTRPPSIDQVQPVADNSNPLVVVVGNPNLKQCFSSNINFHYNAYSVLKQRGVYFRTRVNFANNEIANKHTIDYRTGKTTVEYTNVNGNYSVNSYWGLNAQYSNGLWANSALNFSLYRSTIFINGKQGITHAFQPSLEVSLGYDIEKKLNLSYNGYVGKNFSKSTINTNAKPDYWSHAHGVSGNWFLPWKLQFNSSVNLEFRQKIQTFDNNNNVVLINSFIGRKLFKDDKGLIKIGVNDLLDQNNGYERNITTTGINERTYEALSRYFYLGFVWNFSKAPGQ